MDITKFHTIDWLEDADSLNKTRLARANRKLSIEHFFTACQSWLILAVSGALIGGIAVLLTLVTNWLADLREGYCKSHWYLSEAACCAGQENCTNWVHHHWSVSFVIYVVLSVVFAVIPSFLVSSVAPLAAGSGISEIKCIIQGFSAPQFLDRVVLIVKCAALPLVIASGLSVGKEGPSVHYAACVANIISSLMGNHELRQRRDLLVAGCAAGVAVAFGSPIGGLLFGIEEMATHLSIATITRSYFCCFVATSVVALFNTSKTGQLVLFSVQYDESWYAFEGPFLIILGVFGGFAGRFIIKYNLRFNALRKKYWGSHYLAEAGLLSLLTALICFFNIFLRMDMTKSMQILFHECDHGGESHSSCDLNNSAGLIFSLGTACFLRLILVIISYGAARVPAGIFIPSLAVGALFGRLIGTLVWCLHSKFPESGYFAACRAESNCVNPGAYALLGAAALLSGVMNITLTVVVVIFELTGAVHVILPTMIVVVVTKIIIFQLGNCGIADKAIIQNQYPFLESNPPDYLETRSVSQVMVPSDQCEVVRGGSMAPRGGGQHYKTYPVLDNNDRLVGSLSGDTVDRSPLVVHPSDKLDFVHSLFRELGPHTIYVTDEDKFCGLITRKGLISVEMQNLEAFSDFEDHCGAFIARFLNWIESVVAKLTKLIINKHVS